MEERYDYLPIDKMTIEQLMEKRETRLSQLKATMPDTRRAQIQEDVFAIEKELVNRDKIRSVGDTPDPKNPTVLCSEELCKEAQAYYDRQLEFQAFLIEKESQHN